MYFPNNNDKENEISSANYYNILNLSGDTTFNISGRKSKSKRDTADPVELEDLLKNLNDSDASNVSAKNNYFGFGSVDQIINTTDLSKSEIMVGNESYIKSPMTQGKNISSKKSRNSSAIKKADPIAYSKIYDSTNDDLSHYKNVDSSNGMISPVSTVVSETNNDLTKDDSLNNISSSYCLNDSGVKPELSNIGELNSSNDDPKDKSHMSNLTDGVELLLEANLPGHQIQQSSMDQMDESVDQSPLELSKSSERDHSNATVSSSSYLDLEGSFQRGSSRRETIDSTDLQGLLDSGLEQSGGKSKRLSNKRGKKNRDSTDTVANMEAIDSLLNGSDNRSVSRDMSNRSGLSLTSVGSEVEGEALVGADEIVNINTTADESVNVETSFQRFSSRRDTMDSIDLQGLLDSGLGLSGEKYVPHSKREKNNRDSTDTVANMEAIDNLLNGKSLNESSDIFNRSGLSSVSSEVKGGSSVAVNEIVAANATVADEDVDNVLDDQSLANGTATMCSSILNLSNSSIMTTATNATTATMDVILTIDALLGPVKDELQLSGGKFAKCKYLMNITTSLTLSHFIYFYILLL